ncbi:hypothetical protein CR513_21665, partial [Mucuna pruriens]
MYETVLRDLEVTFPLDHFTIEALRMIGVAPSQLHPNGWAALQAFKVVCLALTMTPSASVFLIHYTVRVGMKAIDGVLQGLQKSLPGDKGHRWGVHVRGALAVSQETFKARTKSVAPVAEKEVAPIGAEKETIPARAKKETVQAKAEKETTAAQPARVETRSSAPRPDPRESKRKAESLAAEEVAQKKGKVVVPSCSPLPPSSSQRRVRLLVTVGVDGTFDMLTAYHVRSLASLEVSRGLVKRAEQILLKETLHKKNLKG